MKRHWIDFSETQTDSPMTYWVHRPVGEFRNWRDAVDFVPPRQLPVPGKGYPLFKVEVDGFIFEFSSLAEMRECIKILEQKLLPRTIDLSAEHGTGMGPNSHWLSRLPSNVKSWKYREGAVKYLHKALLKFATASACR